MEPVHHSDPNPEPSGSDRLHPYIYLALIGVAALFAIAAWSFAGGGYVDYLLVIVTGFAVIAVAIPVILSLVGREPGPDSGDREPTFREWAHGNLRIWDGRVRGANAAVEILLPLSAIAIGMVAIGAVLHLTEHGL